MSLQTKIKDEILDAVSLKNSLFSETRVLLGEYKDCQIQLIITRDEDEFFEGQVAQVELDKLMGV